MQRFLSKNNVVHDEMGGRGIINVAEICAMKITTHASPNRNHKSSPLEISML
jgi:hypothetical protein